MTNTKKPAQSMVAKLGERELERLAQRIEEDYRRAMPDHQRRMASKSSRQL